jgi:hypothetical protein
MMSDNDKAAQEEKARRLREQIDQLKAPESDTAKREGASTPARPKSYRELINERMRQLDQDKKAKG